MNQSTPGGPTFNTRNLVDGVALAEMDWRTKCEQLGIIDARLRSCMIVAEVLHQLLHQATLAGRQHVTIGDLVDIIEELA